MPEDGARFPEQVRTVRIHETTGLQYKVNWWYDAAVGEWISEDPIGFAARDANLSRYVGNNTNLSDPSGLVVTSGSLPSNSTGTRYRTRTLNLCPIVIPWKEEVPAPQVISTIKVPVCDGTGKCHEDDFPDEVPDEWTKEDIETAIDQIKKSLDKRKREMDDHPLPAYPEYNKDGKKKTFEDWQKARDGHWERIRREEEWLRRLRMSEPRWGLSYFILLS